MAVNETEPVVDRTFDFDDVRKACRYLVAAEHQGKVVVSVA